MASPEKDNRSAARRALDEQIAAEPPLAPPTLPADAAPSTMESKLRPRAMAVAGIVENGVVRPLEPAVKLPEHSRVIIVAAEAP